MEGIENSSFRLPSRYKSPSLRDHLSYRSAYYPCKNVLDGDLCEQFNTLEPSKQKGIADELDRSVEQLDVFQRVDRIFHAGII